MSLIMGGGESFPFDKIGDGFSKARVTDISEEQHATDLDSGELKYWDPGKTQKVMQTVVSLELGTHDRTDPTDDGARSLFVQASSNRQKALAKAVRAAGEKEFLVGSLLSMWYTGDGEKKNKGWNAPKIYTAEYVAPVSTGSAAIMGDQTQVPAQLAQAQQAAQAQAVQAGAPVGQPAQDPAYAAFLAQQAAQAQAAPVQAAPATAPVMVNGMDISHLPEEVQRLLRQQAGQA